MNIDEFSLLAFLLPLAAWAGHWTHLRFSKWPNPQKAVGDKA
jgi:hypothetical protein